MRADARPARRCVQRVAGSRAFTLIELLVVIAIIALLLGILVPTLASARDAARGVICQNNLRTLGIAFQGYRDDHEGRFPVATDRVVIRSGLLRPLPVLAVQLEMDLPRLDGSGEEVIADQPWVCPNDRETTEDENHPALRPIWTQNRLLVERSKWQASGWSYWYRPADQFATGRYTDAGREVARKWDYQMQFRRTELIADVGWNHGAGVPWSEGKREPETRVKGRNALWVDGRVTHGGEHPPGPP